MALIIDIEKEDNGAIASYWEVISIFYNHRKNKSSLVMGGWVSKVAYESDKEPLMTIDWEIDAGLAPQLAAGALEFVKNYAKSQPLFEGAIEE